MTLIELMAVVVIIGIFAALAAPAIAGQVADRHVTRAAEDLSGMFRLARSRSAATGAAHAIFVTASGSTLRFDLRAAVDPLGAPVSSCLTPTWSDTDSKLLWTLDLNAGTYAGKNIVASRPTTATGAAVNIGMSADAFCITPGGTPWYRAGTWQSPSGSNNGEFDIIRNDDYGVKRGVTRIVRVGPTGAPRIDVGG